MFKHFSLLFFITYVFCANAQKKYPKHYFDNPLKIPIVFAGTFGELRSNHFHSGIDIKTQGKEGIPIYAPADGYVYRIKTKQYGYGKALYLRHPNGYSTVYAHLQKFNPEIQQFVKAKQYQKKQYYINEYLKPNKFPVTKGEVIGYTGDTGSSGGPHLHYEFRDSKTEHIINPMHFGLTTTDTKHPIINQLMLFPLDDSSRVNNGLSKAIIPFKKTGNGKYQSENITANGTIGLGISVFDRQNLAPNKNGIYSLEMTVNGQLVYYHDLETFSFAESKYINLLIDYEHAAKHKTKIQKTHKVDQNKLSIYENLVNKGKLTIEPNNNYVVKINAKDFHGNTSTITIPIKGVDNNTIFKEKDSTAYKISKNIFSKFEKENVSIAFPKQSVYKDAFIDFDVRNDTAFVHKPIIPLNKRYTLTFSLSHLSPEQRDQVYIANINNPKYPSYAGGKKKEHKIYTTTKTLGTYTLKFDKIKPSISLVNFENNKWISANNTLKVKIQDKESGIKDFKASIDGEWILMEYNHKKKILTYDFSDKVLIGSKHTFKIEVSDNVGNTTSKTITFFRKKN